MVQKRNRTIALLAGCLLIIPLLGCEDSDVIPPDGSTITMNARPSTIILDSSGVQTGPITVLATVRNSLGLPLPGQDVRFTTTSGVLTPNAGTSIETDSDGNANTILSIARQSATITATAGAVSQTLNLSTSTCALSSVGISPSPITLTSCSANDLTFDITATAVDTANDPCVGVQVVFRQIVADPDTDVPLQFSPGSATSNSLGEVRTTLSIQEANCSSLCFPAGDDCGTQFEAVVGSVKSPAVDVVDSVN
jgi:hypothetical protein